MAHLCFRLHIHTTASGFTSVCKLSENSTLAALCKLIFKCSVLFLLSFRHVRRAELGVQTYCAPACNLMVLWCLKKKSTVVIKGQPWLNTPMPNTCRLRHTSTHMQVILHMHTSSVWEKKKPKKTKKTLWTFGLDKINSLQGSTCGHVFWMTR